MLTPISYGFPVSAVTFSTYEGYMKFMEIENRKEMIYKHWIIGGCLAGVAQSVIICPGELLKTVL